jgi:hypothetical protein
VKDAGTAVLPWGVLPEARQHAPRQEVQRCRSVCDIYNILIC